MTDALIQGLALVLQWNAFSLMLVGMALGFVVGLLPGIGGAATLALMLPFVFKMTPVEAFAFLLGMHSLAVSIPIVRPLVLTFGSPELFMVTVMGIACITSLSGLGTRAQIKGFAMGLLGLLLATIGQERQSGILRFDFGLIYLWEGLELIPVLVGIFAIPEIIDVAVRGTSIAGNAPAAKLGAGVWQGIRDTFRHFWLVVRCSVVGVFVGIMPGAGGGVAQWMAYAHAVQSAKDSSDRARFGGGDVRGVLGPGAANNSKEGGDLIPTIAFGVPGSGAMAILLGAFLIMGLHPGPDMLTKHLAVTYSMVWTLVLANVIAVLVCLALLPYLALVTRIRGSVIIPFLLLLVFVGSYTANRQLADLLVTLGFGALGYLMVRFGWPRAPLVLGFVLGKLAETYLFISVARYGFAWLKQPVVLVLIVLTTLVIVWPYLRERRA